MQVKMTTSEMNTFLETVFPQVNGKFVTTELKPMEAKVHMNVMEADLRPGGTVSGPAMFSLADVSFYIVTLAMIGPEALTVTTSCSINFMRKPDPEDMWAKSRILKLGRSLSVGADEIFSKGSDKPVAHANVTYSIPPNSNR